MSRHDPYPPLTLEQHPGLLVKECYWRWPDRELAGNTIDFFTKVLHRTFHQAMLEITQA